MSPRHRHQRTIDVLVSRLRRRLRALAVDAVEIRAVIGIGYCLTLCAAPA